MIGANVPEGSTFMTIGPSMANLVQFYGHRRAYGACREPEPAQSQSFVRAVPNPDQALRDSRSSTSSGTPLGRPLGDVLERLLRYSERYNGRAVHVEALPASTPSGRRAERPAVVVYEVRP